MFGVPTIYPITTGLEVQAENMGSLQVFAKKGQGSKVTVSALSTHLSLASAEMGCKHDAAP